MKFAVVILACVAVASAQIKSALPYNVPAAKVVADSRNAEIVKFSNEMNPDGSYSYFYETNNGIAAQEQGVPQDFGGNPPLKPVVAQGSFSYTAPEGVPIEVRYVADGNGFRPEGNAIPTAPPVPPQIARALAYTATARYESSRN
ncbi:hypothetical protein K1T71_004495 [Dendrolimus kikuchii]|uniref:Uncharacterized protein n=1 Tax=Dendrolimus kikuchii TaxID=765133 RepID=A0ACC1D843_9NEOP|nr:hypothetical protein K1T71_004495 [Dendrolimus kikuchii]